MASLPYAEDAFDTMKYANRRDTNRDTYFDQMKDFDKTILGAANADEPYRYGSYYILEANNDTKSFKFATFVNTTSQDASAFFPQFLYQSILREAMGDPDFIFNVSTMAYPTSTTLNDRDASGDAIFLCIIAGIGYALIPATIISNIVSERYKGLKHIQMVSGMSLQAYWASNFAFDVMKTMIPCVFSVTMFFVF